MFMSETFSMGGEVASLRDTAPNDALHPGFALVVDVGGQYCRIVVPHDVWPVSRELLQVGQWVHVTGVTDSCPFIHGSRQVATAVRLAGVYH